ncbi:MAG TPA: toll/interleukin-1 receptor domain-containing protein [Thermoanaerobaculia bacterium]
MKLGEMVRFWEQLLQFIEEGRVVPIVGRDLLTLDLGDRQVLLYDLLAERLAGKLGLPAEGSPCSLNDVACSYLAEGGELEDIYSALKSILAGPDALPIPRPLLDLAGIRPLKLFVSTTFDPLLARAIDEVRFGGAAKTEIFAYSPNAGEDLRSPVAQLERPAVFHLFGKVSAVPDYAVTDEDLLEFVHSLQSEARRPNLLFDELNRRQLLLIGSNFSDWLVRFFLRMAKRERLWQARGGTDIVADARVCEDSGLVLFLQRFSARTKVFPGGAVEFVRELAERWHERHPPAEPAAEPRRSDDPAGSGAPEMEPGAVFLSYASEDLAVVQALKEELEAAGVDVWFDKDALRLGDAYEAKIRGNIDGCSLFVPILSRHTLTPGRRFFRIEWDHAEKVAVQVAPSMPFIVPVAIDDISPNEPAIPERFRKVHWQRLPSGKSTPELVGALRQLFRDYQKTIASTL